MDTPATSPMHDPVLQQLLAIVEDIALNGDLRSVIPLLTLTNTNTSPPLVASLAEAISRMVIKLEAREFQLECIIEELTEIKKELELANYDALTGLPNRVIARDRLQTGLRQARSQAQQLAVMYLDLDRFKWVNDNLGHAAGDELLKQVAGRLRDCVRSTDTVARLGGDEFLCVLPGLEDPAVTTQLASRIVDALVAPFALEAGSASISVSVGIALFPEHAQTLEQLISCADKAMYESKCAGRNGFRVFSLDTQL